MRMSIKRFTRLTNAFSKKLENLQASLSLHYYHYNFCRTHKTIGATPAIASGLSSYIHNWDALLGIKKNDYKVA